MTVVHFSRKCAENQGRIIPSASFSSFGSSWVQASAVVRTPIGINNMKPMLIDVVILGVPYLKAVWPEIEDFVEYAVPGSTRADALRRLAEPPDEPQSKEEPFLV